MFKDLLACKAEPDSAVVDFEGKYDPLSRNMAISKTYKIGDLKAKSKKHGVSLNTYTFGAIMKAIVDYSEGKEPSPFLAAMCSTSRKAFKTFDDFTCDNQIATPTFAMQLDDSLGNCIKNAEDKLKVLKLPGLTTESIKGEKMEAMFLPIWLRRKLYSNLNTLRFVCISMAGPPKQMFFEGKKVDYRISAVGAFTNTFAIQTLGENAKITLNSNSGFFKDSKGLLKAVEKVIDED